MALMVVGCKDGRIPDLARNGSPLITVGVVVGVVVVVVVASEDEEEESEEDEVMVVFSSEEDVMCRRYEMDIPSCLGVPRRLIGW